MAWGCQDWELAAEEAALGGLEPPSLEELAGLVPDPGAGPPDGAGAWLADLPGPLLGEYLEAASEPAGPEPIKAGFWDRTTGDGAGFASGGVADDLAPGPVLAGLTADTCGAGLGRLSDDELIGVLRAARKLTSWATALELAAVCDLARRREAEAGATGDCRVAERVPAEVAAALTLTARSADSLVTFAASLTSLPQTFAALRTGQIDRQKALVIADEAAALAPAERAEVEQHILPDACGQTTGQLRAAARRAVIAADADAARKRQQKAQRDARVERWHEQAGTAALAGRDLPPAGVLAAGQHISTLARYLKTAGMAGTMDQLRAQVFVALLAGQPVESLLPGPATPGPAGPGTASPGDTAPSASPPGAAGPGGFPSTASPDSAADHRGFAPAGAINLTMPVATWLGLSQTPGDVAGFGPLGADDSRSLAGSMAWNAATRWCLTVTDENGQAVAHGCARASPRARGAPARSSGPGPPDRFPAWLAGITMEWFEGSGCSHRRESAGYQPSPSLRHLINIRQRTCAYPGCRRPATRCDQDHTIPYDKGGRTCGCNLAPLCRAHHETKQTRGWRLEQPCPGHLTWTAPSGRTYTTHPTEYPR